jgi:hypothetical protein
MSYRENLEGNIENYDFYYKFKETWYLIPKNIVIHYLLDFPMGEDVAYWNEIDKDQYFYERKIVGRSPSKTIYIKDIEEAIITDDITRLCSLLNLIDKNSILEAGIIAFINNSKYQPEEYDNLQKYVDKIILQHLTTEIKGANISFPRALSVNYFFEPDEKECLIYLFKCHYKTLMFCLAESEIPIFMKQDDIHECDDQDKDIFHQFMAVFYALDGIRKIRDDETYYQQARKIYDAFSHLFHNIK